MTTAAAVDVPAPSPALDDLLASGPDERPADSAAPSPAVSPAGAAASGAAALSADDGDTPRRLLPWLGHVGCFVGAGLVSGGIVHHPLAPVRYSLIAAAGVVLFLAATAVNEVLLAEEKPGRSRLLRVLGASLLLSLGIGMLSGGIQHFSDLGQRAATLVPAGLVLSFVAYALRSGWDLRQTLLSRLAGGLVLAAVGLFFGLGQLAGDAPAGHGHGESAPAATHTGGTHTDAAHTDTAHAGAPPAEAAHTDPAHSDAAHTDPAHSGPAHTDPTQTAPAAPAPVAEPAAPVDLQAELARLAELQKQLTQLKSE